MSILLSMSKGRTGVLLSGCSNQVKYHHLRAVKVAALLGFLKSYELWKYHYSTWISQIKFHLDMQTKVWYLPAFKEKVELNSY